MVERPRTSNPVTLRPYQWSVSKAVLKVLLYPLVLGTLGAFLATLSGNGGVAPVFLYAIPVLTLPVAGIVGLQVSLNRRTMVTADDTEVVKRGPLRTAACPRDELEAIQYSSPLRGALECQFLRKDGRTAFRITLAPWNSLQHDLEGFAAALRVPLRPNRWAGRFRLQS